MRRALALALIGGAAYAGWRYWSAGGFGGAPSAGASMGAIEAYQPGELRAELDVDRYLEQATPYLGSRVDGPGESVVGQVPVGSLAEQVAALVALGRARDAGGLQATYLSTPADRRVIAEAECRRAGTRVGLPVWVVDDCTRALATAPIWQYRPPTGRAATIVYIGPGGLPGVSAPTATPR